MITKFKKLFKKKKKEGNKMDLFKNENNKKEDIKEEPEEEVIDDAPVQSEDHPRMTRQQAEVNFKILVRNLNDLELQIKSGKPTDVDETKLSKMPTMNTTINKAEAIKLMMADFIDAFKATGYYEEDIQKLKSDALEGKKNYKPITID